MVFKWEKKWEKGSRKNIFFFFAYLLLKLQSKHENRTNTVFWLYDRWQPKGQIRTWGWLQRDQFNKTPLCVCAGAPLGAMPPKDAFFELSKLQKRSSTTADSTSFAQLHPRVHSVLNSSRLALKYLINKLLQTIRGDWSQYTTTSAPNYWR